MDENRELANFAENLWNNYISKKIDGRLETSVSFYRAEVIETHDDSTLTVQRPFRDPIRVACTRGLGDIQVGEQVVVFVLGNKNGKNAIVFSNGTMSDIGTKGKDGKSAYEIAVEEGFEGTEEEWIESLKGKGIDTITTWYKASALASGETRPEEGEEEEHGWYLVAPEMTSENKYLWTYEKVVYTSGNPPYTFSSPRVIGVYGQDGRGIAAVIEHYLAWDSSDITTVPARTDSRWDTQITLSDEFPYMWNYTTIRYTEGEATITDFVIIGVKGRDGSVVEEVHEYYRADPRSEGVLRSDVGWTQNVSDIKLDSVNKYLWNYEEYVDATFYTFKVTEPIIIGMYSGDGKNVSRVVEHYYANSAQSPAPSIDEPLWDVQTELTEENRYLWNYSTTVYTNGSESNSNPRLVGIFEEGGTPGKRIDRVVNYYARSASATVEPARSEYITTVPTLSLEYPYLWSFRVFYYVNVSEPEESEHTVISMYGDDGRGIDHVEISYQRGISPTSVPTGTWTSLIPEVEPGLYLWTRCIQMYTDGTQSEPIYSVAKQGRGTLTWSTDTAPMEDEGTYAFDVDDLYISEDEHQVLTGDMVMYDIYRYTITSMSQDGSVAYSNHRIKIKGEDAAIISENPPEDTTYLWCDISAIPSVLRRYNSQTQEWDMVNDTDERFSALQSRIDDAVKVSSDTLVSWVGTNYYDREDLEERFGSISTRIEQNQSDVSITFENMSADLKNLTDSTAENFRNIASYIRFINGQIHLYNDTSEFKLIISNDKISFLDNDVEVAYISNQKLYITTAHVTSQMRIGNFAWVPDSNGGLTLKKVV